MTTREPSIENLGPLGAGATGSVELGRLRAPLGGLPSGALVAVKTLAEERRLDVRARRAFAAEAEAAQEVVDPSLVRVLHHGETEAGAPYIVMRYVPGKSLREILDEEGPLPEPLVRRVGAQLAGAVAALHGAGLVHGDVKPENIRMDEEGRAVLLDLGFARRFADPADASPHAGSLAYLSPERARGAPPSRTADVFALGIVLYELATGFHPFGFAADPERARHAAALFPLGSSSGELLRRSIEVPGADEVLAAITSGRATAPSLLVPQLSPFLDHVLLDALARAPGRRPSAVGLAERLREGESSPWWRKLLEPGSLEVERPAEREAYHLTPLVGREEELALLGQALERVRGAGPRGGAGERPGGRSQVVWLSGPGGMGKWRLVNEFASRARASREPPLYLYARCNDAAEARPAGSLSVLLHRGLQLPPGTPPGAREEEELRTLVPPATARTLLAALHPESVAAFEGSVAAALSEWVAAFGRRRPLVVFLDDLHRAGSETLGALTVLVDALSQTRVLLVLGTRDDAGEASPEMGRLREHLAYLAERGAEPDFHQLDLGPLDETDLQELVERLFDRSVPRLRLAHVLWLRSRGNPGLVAEILRELAAKGLVTPRGEDPDLRLTLAVAPDELPLPRSLQRIIAERLATLDPEDELWLERLSVVGGRLAPDFLVLAFSPTQRQEIDAVLARLVRKGWLVPAGSRYRFARPALREAVYLSIPAGRRRRLHAAAARGLAGDASDEGRFQRLFHLRSAGEPRPLLEELVPLFERVRRRVSAQRLFTLARWGLEALEELEATPEHNAARLGFLEAAADAADRLGARREERAFLDHLADLDLDPQEHPAEGARIYLLHGRYAAGTGQFGLARGMLRNAVRLAETGGEPALSSEALRRLSLVQAQIGDLAEARQLGVQALAIAASENQRAVAELALSSIAILEDRIEEALARIDRAIGILRGASDVRLGVVSLAQMLRGRAWRSAGRSLRALGAAARAVRLAQRSGERRLEAEARARFGLLLLDADRPDEAEEQLRDALLVADEIEDRRGAVLAGLLLGILLWESEDAGAAESIRRATALAHEIGFYRAEAVGLAFQARVHREGGETDAALAASASAFELLERHGAELADRVTIAGTRILVLRNAGQEAAARSVRNALRTEIRGRNARVRDPALRRGQKEYVERLLEAVLSPDGPVYPRTPSHRATPRV